MATIHLDSPLPMSSSDLPAHSTGRLSRVLLGLAPGGVYRAGDVTATAVVSYTTLSPLPTNLLAVCFLWHYPADHSGWALPTTVPEGARTFLGAPECDATVRPTGPCSIVLALPDTVCSGFS